MATVGIVICSRIKSSRIPNKCFTSFNGITALEHLIRRVGGDYPIYVAVPEGEGSKYSNALNRCSPITIVEGHGNDPLKRMAMVARDYNLDCVVRITHDKIFVDLNDIRYFIRMFENSNVDYLYSSHFIPGCGFEVIRNNVLQQAAKEFVDVEHISYAIRTKTTNVINVPLDRPKYPPRLLLDYPEDILTLRAIFSALGEYCTLDQVLNLCDTFHSIKSLNALPDVTVYTCAYNAGQWIDECVSSVDSLLRKPSYEYLVIDDASTDNTGERLRDLQKKDVKMQVCSNVTNMGLSSSSSLALSMARGEYIIRLDADDRFTRPTVLEELVSVAKRGGYDVVYPGYFDGGYNIVAYGHVNHHCGGALFNTRALNFVKFTEGLRHHDSFDLWSRLDGKLRIGYYEKPCFFYRHTPESMSRSNHELRAKIKDEIRAKISSH